MYNEYNKNNELYHHGVKGMKWGVRKAAVSTGNYLTRTTKQQLNTAKKASSKHTLGGHAVRAVGRTIVNNMLAGGLAFGVSALSGGTLAPVAAAGYTAYTAMNVSNQAAGLVAKGYYKYK